MTNLSRAKLKSGGALFVGGLKQQIMSIKSCICIYNYINYINYIYIFIYHVDGLQDFVCQYEHSTGEEPLLGPRTLNLL